MFARKYLKGSFFLCGGQRPRVSLVMALALAMAAAKFAFIPANEMGVALYEETSIYLNAAHLSFLSHLMYPDAGYINFVPKLAAFLALRLPGLAAIYPAAFKFLSLFFAALGLLLFLSDRFAAFSPAFSIARARQARLGLCLLFFFFPGRDLLCSYNASYYMVFPLMWYLLRTLDAAPFRRRDCLFILLTGFAAVWSKPLLFPFGLLILGVSGWWCVRAVRYADRDPDWLRLFSLFWLLALYGVQFSFSLCHPLTFATSGMETLSRLAGSPALIPLLVAWRCVIFLGYGLAAPLYWLSGGFSGALSATAGVCVLGMAIANARFLARQRGFGPMLLFAGVSAGMVFGVYGILANDWLSACNFSGHLFSSPNNHRHLFLFVLFSNFSALLWAGRQTWRWSFAGIACYALAFTLLSLTGLYRSYPAGQGHSYALNWSEARELLRDGRPFIPIPQLMKDWLPADEKALSCARNAPYNPRIAGMFYTPSCDWGSGVVGAAPQGKAPAGESRHAYRHSFSSPRARAVTYLLIFPDRVDNVRLTEGTKLIVGHGGQTWQARLVNPGKRPWYLFAFDRAVPSSHTNSFFLETPDGAPPRSAFHVFMAGTCF